MEEAELLSRVENELAPIRRPGDGREKRGLFLPYICRGQGCHGEERLCADGGEVLAGARAPR
jgi:hypothetical protein